jgi:hypothetical protein
MFSPKIENLHPNQTEKNTSLTRHEIFKAGPFNSFCRSKLAPFVIADACTSNAETLSQHQYQIFRPRNTAG